MKKLLNIALFHFIFTIISYCQCGIDSVKDYDGNLYHTVKIGDQCWIKENLRTTHYADGIPISKVAEDTLWDKLDNSDKAYCWYRNDSASYAEIYGALYTWAAAMNGARSSNSNPSGVQGICPDGWHLPSYNEWKELQSALGGVKNVVDRKLADSANLWQDGILENNDEFGSSGFTALPGGFRYHNGYFYAIRNSGFWWSSYEESLEIAYYRNINPPYTYKYCKKSGISVRCIKDE